MKKGVLVGVGLMVLPACAAPTGDTDSRSSAAEEVTSACPVPSATDTLDKVAATLALQLMSGAAEMGGATAPAWSNTVLASQRYRIQASGTGIEFEPADPLYPYVTNKMKAALAFAQLDPTMAKYLSDALQIAFNTTTGDRFASIRAVSALAGYRNPGPQTAHIPDPSSANDSHWATVTTHAWCGVAAVTIDETVQQSWQFAPIYKDSIFFWNNAWLSHAPPAFHGSLFNPSSPFNGPSGSNPYLVISMNGQKATWAQFDKYTYVNCWQQPNETCEGQLEIDPIPYAEPGAYYDTTQQLVGTQTNPFSIVGSLYATADHQGQWATRVVNGVQEWGTFSTPVTLFGVTMYKYLKQH